MSFRHMTALTERLTGIYIALNKSDQIYEQSLYVLIEQGE